MTTATFYKNGFQITEHTREDICSELSMFAWTVTQIMLNIDRTDGEYITDEDTGYGHFTFNHNDQTLAHIFSVATQMLPIWAKKYEWDSFVEINVKDELFRPKAIDRPNRLNVVEADKDFERCGNPMKPNIAEIRRANDEK